MFSAKVHGTNADEYGSYTRVTFYDISKEGKYIDVNQILTDKILKDISIASKIQVIVKIYITVIQFQSYNSFFIFYILSVFFIYINHSAIVDGTVNRIIYFAYRRVW